MRYIYVTAIYIKQFIAVRVAWVVHGIIWSARARGIQILPTYLYTIFISVTIMVPLLGNLTHSRNKMCQKRLQIKNERSLPWKKNPFQINLFNVIDKTIISFFLMLFFDGFNFNLESKKQSESARSMKFCLLKNMHSYPNEICKKWHKDHDFLEHPLVVLAVSLKMFEL